MPFQLTVCICGYAISVSCAGHYHLKCRSRNPFESENYWSGKGQLEKRKEFCATLETPLTYHISHHFSGRLCGVKLSIAC